MKRLLTIIAMLAMMTVVAASAYAGSSATINVTVTIATEASISVTGGPVAFGSMGVGAYKVSTTPIVVKNDGTGAAETYSLSLINPSAWTAVTGTPSVDQYRLSAAFDSDGSLTWDPANLALTTSSQASTASKFAGDETGLAVPYNADRHLYFKLETPSASSATSEQTIQVVIAAAVV